MQRVWKILKDEYDPYHIQRFQAPADFPLRTALCQWMLQKLVLITQFLTKSFFTDGANFSRNTIRNFNKNRMWTHENPLEVYENRFKNRFSLNI